jgi:PknH-like extracellular domain
VIGVAQVDQYAVVYTDDAAAQRALDRARGRAQSCDVSFAVHSPDARAEATIADAPGGLDGFRVHATYSVGEGASTSDEASAVLRRGSTVLYLRVNETGSGQNTDMDVDGTLDPSWVDQLFESAAAHLTE